MTVRPLTFARPSRSGGRAHVVRVDAATLRPISRTDPRSIKAVEIAAGAGQWLKCHTRDGSKRYGVPSQSAAGLHYLADCHTCTCQDFARRQQPCKHVLAVRLHVAGVRAQQTRREVSRAA
jgi:SWIM zinc finger